jgi:predicted CDP-diglyceride synthetase/phosphatidate cytidylyltransferase
MMRNDRSTITMYPLVWHWAGRALIYLILLLVPAFAIQWLVEQLPKNAQSTTAVVANVVALPLIYIAIYLGLRKIGARSQKFIYFVILLFIAMGYAEGKRAFATGQFQSWAGLVMSIFYVGAFSWIAFRGAKANRNDAISAYEAAREEQISIQAEAILRAQQLQQQREASGK